MKLNNLIESLDAYDSMIYFLTNSDIIYPESNDEYKEYLLSLHDLNDSDIYKFISDNMNYFQIIIYLFDASENMPESYESELIESNDEYRKYRILN